MKNEANPLLETIHRYIKPEMSILISGYRFSYLPFPLIVNAEFTGTVTTLSRNHKYFIETSIDKGIQIQSTEKSRFVYPLPESSDFIMLSESSEENHNVVHMFFELQSLVKPGGYMFMICPETEGRQVFNQINNADFELIEVFENKLESFFLIKKGWSFNYNQLDL